MGPEIDDLVPRRAEPGDDLLLQAKPAMIGGDPHSHSVRFSSAVTSAHRCLRSESSRAALPREDW